MSPRHRARHASEVRPRNPGHLDDDSGATASGVTAWLRRYPRLPRCAAFGSITAGAALFVLASLSAPLAGAQTGHATGQPRPSTGVPAPPELGARGLTVPVTPTPAALKTGPAAKVQPAPVTAAVISGLAANGVPNLALNAYRVAAARMNHSDPSCGIDWSLLAGIGREESDHGRFDGAVLNADGTSTPEIVGVALNGVGDEYLPAPANGLALDGDARYTHALGPMQFIPQTWARYGVTAQGYGPPDVFNINDAALTAARYLCAAGGDLRTHAGQVAAVLAYNHSDEYLAQVLALADAYRRGVALTGLPTGNTTGPVAAGANTDVPPANPGGPTALEPTPAAVKATAHPSTAGKATAGPSTASSPGPVRSAPSKAPSAGPSAGLSAPTDPPPVSPTTSTPASPNPTAPSSGSTPPSPPVSSPAPSPTKHCILPNLLNPGHCALYS